jgi:hypothetical protein
MFLTFSGKLRGDRPARKTFDAQRELSIANSAAKIKIAELVLGPARAGEGSAVSALTAHRQEHGAKIERWWKTPPVIHNAVDDRRAVDHRSAACEGPKDLSAASIEGMHAVEGPNRIGRLP